MKPTILTIFPYPPDREGFDDRTGSSAKSPAPQPPAALTPLPSADSTSTPMLERLLLQKLLGELDARPLPQPQRPYAMESPRARRTGWFRAMWAGLWVLSLVACVFVVRYLDGQYSAQIPPPAQVPLINNLAATLDDQNRQLSQMVNSVERLASAVGSSPVRSREIHPLLRRESAPAEQPVVPAVVENSKPAPEPSPAAIPENAQSVNSTEALLGGHHHSPIDDIVAMPNMIVHHNARGMMDYWLVPRMVSGVKTMTKVVPIAQTGLGVFVHAVDEVRDYIITPSGDWFPASEPNQSH